MAAFSISGYAWATWRYRYKPFNPVLGETYENHREDRGFYYVSEQVSVSYKHVNTSLQSSPSRNELCVQVSHHPPISACHAESENFTFWQGKGLFPSEG